MAFCLRALIDYLSQCWIITNGIMWQSPKTYFIGSAHDVNLLLGFNTLRPRQNGRHLPDVIFKCISLNKNEWISIEISLKFVRKGSINNIHALIQIMAWCRPGDKPLSELMMACLLTHICVTRPQWVKSVCHISQGQRSQDKLFLLVALIYT